MISTYNELYKFMDESNDIGEDALAILEELDGTGSVVTQASLNEILVGLYNRLDKDNIRIVGVGEHVTKEQFAAWVESVFDPYTAGLFRETALSEE